MAEWVTKVYPGKMTEAGGQEQGAIIDMFLNLSGPFMCADSCPSPVEMCPRMDDVWLS